MKRIVPFIILLVALLLPSTVFARIAIVPVTQIVYDNLGEVSVEQLSPGIFKVETIGLSGAGKVECDGNPNCPPRLNGIMIGFSQQGMQIVIDWRKKLVEGRARGKIIWPSQDGSSKEADFRGQIVGQITQDEIEGSLPLDLNIRARLDSGQEWQGIMELELSGILARGDDITPPHWTSLGGTGTIAISGLKAEAGEE